MQMTLFLILVGVASRFLSLPHGITLTAALILLAGACLRPRETVLVALGIMAIGDLFKGFHLLVPWTWSGAILMGWVSWLLLKRVSYPRVAFASIAASTVYYLWCEFGIWVMGNCLPGGRIHPLTASGLIGVYQSGWNHYLYRLVGNLALSLVVFTIARNLLGVKVAARQKATVNI